MHAEWQQRQWKQQQQQQTADVGRLTLDVDGAPSTGLSHEQLRRILKEARVGKQGLSRSATDHARALMHVAVLQEQHGVSYDVAIKTTATAEFVSPSTLRSAAQQFAATGMLPETDTAHRGRGNLLHPLHSSNTEAYGPTLKAEQLIHDLVHSQKTEGASITSTIIAAELRARLGVPVHCCTVRRWLNALGYRWRNKRYVGGMKPRAKNVRIRQFIIEYAAALAEEAAGTAIVVYMDESYIHSHLASKKGWFHLSNRDVLGDDNGTRLIILHAMTDSGLLAVPDTIASNWLSEPALTAELVFEEVLEDGQDDSDYHNTMTGPKFVAWLRNRLLPTFAAMYPGKKMYLLMDNAGYHKPRDESWVSSSKAQNKHELVHKLLDLGVQQLTTRGSTPRVVPAHRFDASVSEGGPTKEDLLAAVQKWLSDHPDQNRTVVEQLMDDAGHALVYTPPYCPEVQPIELLWAKVKRYVAIRSTHKRSVTEAREQTEQGFQEVTKMFCNSVVKHCHDWIDGFLSTEEAEDLQQCGTLAGVIKHLPLLKAAGEQAPAPSCTAVPMEISPSRAPAAASASSATRTLRKRH